MTPKVGDQIAHNRMDPSSLPDTMVMPFGENDRLLTQPVWPLNASPLWLPVSTSHNRMVLSEDPLAMVAPLGENARHHTL